MLAAHNDIHRSPTPVVLTHLDEEARSSSSSSTSTAGSLVSRTPSDEPNLLGEGTSSNNELFRDVESHPVRSKSSSSTDNPGCRASTGKFRLQSCKRIALTYAQCQLDPQVCVDELRLLCRYYEPDLIIVGQEQHQKGGLHLHAYVRLARELSTRDQHFFDIKRNVHLNDEDYHAVYHPKIESVRDEVAWEKYVCKDGDYRCFPAWYHPDCASKEVAQQQKKSTKCDQVAQMIMKEGKTPAQVREALPAFFIFHTKQVYEFYHTYLAEKDAKHMRNLFNCLTSFAGDGVLDNQRIAGWLNDHVVKQHEFRSPCLWIWGGTKIGKTQLAEQLRSLGVNTLVVDYASHFYNGISEATQLIVFDEFKAQRSITEMNKLCDGSRCQLDTKGSYYQLTKPLPVLVLSNFAIGDAYHNAELENSAWLDTLRGRFIEIHATAHIVVNSTVVPFDLD
nr:MAG: replication associated protein [Cressdnaviricota sp.]